MKITKGKVHNTKITSDLICADNTIIFGAKGYVSDERKRVTQARGTTWAVKRVQDRTIFVAFAEAI